MGRKLVNATNSSLLWDPAIWIMSQASFFQHFRIWLLYLRVLQNEPMSQMCQSFSLLLIGWLELEVGTQVGRNIVSKDYCLQCCVLQGLGSHEEHLYRLMEAWWVILLHQYSKIYSEDSGAKGFYHWVYKHSFRIRTKYLLSSNFSHHP